MRLAGVRSYPEMIAANRTWTATASGSSKSFGGDLSRASDVQLLPMTLAPKGFTVEERRTLADEAEAAERAAELEITKAEAAGRVEAVRHQVAAETGVAAADAEASTAEAQAREESARAQAELARVRAERTAEAHRARAAEARRAIAVMEAEAQTADDWASLTPRQRRASQVARMILAAGAAPTLSTSSR
jgi:hypothetical protein